MRIPKTRIIVVGIPKTRIIVDRFLRVLSLKGWHIDLTHTQLTDLIGFYINGTSKDIDTSIASLSTALRYHMSHKDVDTSTISSIHSILYSSIRSIDEDRSSIRGIVATSIDPDVHIDEDRSSIKTMQVRPMFLRTLTAYTLGELSAMRLDDMNYEQI